MSSKSKKAKRKKKQKVKRLILSACVCVLIQIGMIYAFFTFLPDKEPLDSNDLYALEIRVDYTKYITRPSGWADDFEVYSNGICYRFRDGVFGEPGPNQLSKQIQSGDTITVLCLKNESQRESWYPCDWIIYDAYSDTEVYRDVDKLNKDQKAMRLFLIVVSTIFELGFLLLIAGYFYHFFGPAYRSKKKPQKKEKKAKTTEKGYPS